MIGLRTLTVWWCVLLVGGPVGAVEFGAMMLHPRREPEVRETIDWARSGSWDWIRVMAPPATNLGTGLGRVLWPAARFEPAAFSPEISTARLAEDPWKVYDAARSGMEAGFAAACWMIAVCSAAGAVVTVWGLRRPR